MSIFHNTDITNELFHGTARPVGVEPSGQSLALVAAGCVEAPRGEFSPKEMQMPATTPYPPLKRTAIPASPAVGHVIRVARRAHKLTLVQLAHHCGVRQATLSLVELGKSGIGPELTARICATLNIPIAALLCELAPAAAAPSPDGDDYVI
jgi:DNA-binding XRE family transcriptional regulator